MSTDTTPPAAAPQYPDHAIRDGHAMRLIIETEYVDLRLHCPWDETGIAGVTPACRIHYGEDGQEIEGDRLTYCNLRTWLDETSQTEAIHVPGGGRVEITSAPFPIAWWWNADDECYSWGPDVAAGSPKGEAL